jgi:hypothetical protein
VECTTARLTFHVPAFVTAPSASSARSAQAATVEPLAGRGHPHERPPLQTSIARESDWTRIWKDSRVPGLAPKIDFQKTLGLVAVRRSSLVKFMGLNLEDGNLRTNVVVAPDMPDYMSCAIVLIKRTGIKKVNGNPVGQ